MNVQAILENRVLLTALTAWFLAQLLKLPIDYLLNRKWNWAVAVSAGGMPSSHSALIVSSAHAIGLYYGFDTPAFALAVAIAMIVVYDAAGVRRQAGIQAERINFLIGEFFKGHPISQRQLREVLGHTPLEVLGGILLGLVVSQAMWFFWR